MRKVIHFMALMKEVYFIFDIKIPKPKVFWKVSKDNKNCISVAESNKSSPITKYIAINYHHFRSFILNKIISIWYIDTIEQTVDIFTNPLDESFLIYIERKLYGWRIKRWNFASTRGIIIIQSNNWFGRSGRLYFETPHKRF